MGMAIRVITIAVFPVLLLLSSCTGFHRNISPVEERALRQNIVTSATNLSRTPLSQSFHVNDRSYLNDCSGFVQAIWDRAGVTTLLNMECRNNGVACIYELLKAQGKIFMDMNLLAPGDVVFFDNTWDSNGDGSLNDTLTHIGVVVTLEEDGTVCFLNRTGRGLTEDRLNLQYKHDHKNGMKVVNSFLRRKTPRDLPQTPYLCGELVKCFGTF